MGQIPVATVSARGMPCAEIWLIACTEKAAARPAGKARFSWGQDGVNGCTAINRFPHPHASSDKVHRTGRGPTPDIRNEQDLALTRLETRSKLTIPTPFANLASLCYDLQGLNYRASAF